MFAGLASFLQIILDGLVAAVNLVFSFFPDSPFQFIADSSFSSLISQVNYFVPVYEVVSICESWLVSIGIYYAYSLWARWVKAVE